MRFKVLVVTCVIGWLLVGCGRPATSPASSQPQSPSQPTAPLYPPGPVEPFISLADLRQVWQRAEELTTPPRVEVKGIYLTQYTIQNPGVYTELLNLVERTELNAMVINVKDDDGLITFQVAEPVAVKGGAVTEALGDVRTLLADLERRGIYTIARVVTFKDPRAAAANPQLAAQRVGGGLWRDYNGVAWLDPYNREAWDYVVRIAKAAALAGFKEIQFDYVRFPTDGNLELIVYPKRDGRAREQVIGDFLTHARKELRPYGVWVSADVFGLVTSVSDDMGIGQKLEEVARGVDYMSPMVYPSHYARGNLGIPNPNAAPYQTIYRSMLDAKVRLNKFPHVTMRPWLQDFSWGHPYGPDEVRGQIQAVYDAGYKEWILWNAANVYTEAALQKP